MQIEKNKKIVRPYGIELELSRRFTKVNNSDRTYGPMWTALKNLINLLYENNKISPGWRCKTDTSCGGEIVSPPLNTLYGLVETAIICEEVKKLGKGADVPIVDGECGLHFHFDASDYIINAKKFRNLFLLIKFYEPLFYYMYPARNEEYCKPLQVNMKQASRIRDMIDVRDVWYRGYNNVKNNKANYSPDFINTSRINKKYDGTRYHGFNLHCLWDIGTVEFRYCEGTFNPLDILYWYKICSSIVEKALLTQKFQFDEFIINQGHDMAMRVYSEPGRLRSLITNMKKVLKLDNKTTNYIIKKIKQNNKKYLTKRVVPRLYGRTSRKINKAKITF